MTAAVYSYSTSSVGHFSPPLLSFGFPFATFSQIVLHNLANWQHLAARGAKTISLGSQLTAIGKSAVVDEANKKEKSNGKTSKKKCTRVHTHRHRHHF